MKETVKVNFALEPETVANLETLCKETHRGKSDVVDWLVSEAIIRRMVAIAPVNGEYTNGKRCVMVKHADGRIEITEDFAATSKPVEEKAEE